MSYKSTNDWMEILEPEKVKWGDIRDNYPGRNLSPIHVRVIAEKYYRGEDEAEADNVKRFMNNDYHGFQIARAETELQQCGILSDGSVSDRYLAGDEQDVVE